MKNILDIAKKINLQKSDLYFYGDEIAKVKIFDKNGNFNMKNRKNYDFSCENSNLILVTAINPTKSGEGKTTVSIGIADSLKKLNQNVCLCLREPSLGPVFGVKGGACGGGKAKIEPEEKINLHFTGDFHAITSANNLLCSIIDTTFILEMSSKSKLFIFIDV